MVTSGITGSPVVSVRINGVRKTVSAPVTGFGLHQLAGFPNRLTANGETVEKTAEPFNATQDMELTAEYGDGHGLDTPHPKSTPAPKPITEAPVVAEQQAHQNAPAAQPTNVTQPPPGTGKV